MSTVINQRKSVVSPCRTSEINERLESFLPSHLLSEIEYVRRSLAANERIEEIRLRSGRRAYLTLGGTYRRNLALKGATDASELTHVLDRMCDGSLYAYGESIKRGYISLDGGIRVGVCGRASVEGGRILGIYDISALNIRLPCGRVSIDKCFLNRIRRSVEMGEGVLIYSPPAEGKTTFLRSLALSLAEGENALRVCVVDTRDELAAFEGEASASLDILSGYPKAEGIRIATAFMNPQVIICDEIGDLSEAEAIVDAQNCGVPLIASSHGRSVEGLLLRQGMNKLHSVGAFGLYVGIRIGGLGGSFEYKTQCRKEIGFENDRDRASMS